jgi:hypothetical protein
VSAPKPVGFLPWLLLDRQVSVSGWIIGFWGTFRGSRNPSLTLASDTCMVRHEGFLLVRCEECGGYNRR